MAFSDSRWVFKHPKTLYAWEGACVWIPCSYRIAGHGKTMDTLVVYHNYTYDEKAKEYHGKILCNKTKTEEPCLQQSVKFLGDIKSNCTLSIQPVQAQDNGLLGLRMTSAAGKWMENIFLNISGKALGDGQRQGRRWETQGLKTRLPAEARHGVPSRDSGSTTQWGCGQLEREHLSLLQHPTCHSAPAHSGTWVPGYRIFQEKIKC